MNDSLADIADRLEAISEELAEQAIDMLTSAIRERQPEQAATEKRLTQARRSVEKAAHLLRGAALDDER
jgi:hypothetical protein